MGSLRHTRSGRQADSTPRNDRFAALVRQAGAGIAQVDSAGRFMLTNQRFHDILGRSAEDLKTLRARDIVHPDDRHDFDARFQCLFREGRDYVDERRYLRPDGVTVWVTASVAPVLDEAGRPQSAVAVIQDITERKRAEAELRRSDATLRLIADNVEAVFWIEDLTARRKIYVSPRYELLWGRPAERLYQNAEDWLNSIHPEDRQRTEAAFRRGMTAGHYDEIFRVVLPNGGIRWIRDRGWTVPDPTGETRRAVGIAEDVTEHHTAEELQRTLIAELNHRVRNTLAVVQAIAHQTIRQSPSMDAFAESFIGRVQALADVHSLLTHTQWRSADLKTILESALRPYDAGRTEFDGPDLELPPRLALAFALVFHELATNAAKHGALSNPKGYIVIRWNLEPADGARRFHLDWTERDGPKIERPGPPRFGTSLIQGTIRYELKGTLDLNFDPRGLHCTMSVPWPESAGTEALPSS